MRAEDDPNPPTTLLFLPIIDGMFLAGIIIPAGIFHNPQNHHQQQQPPLYISVYISEPCSLSSGLQGLAGFSGVLRWRTSERVQLLDSEVVSLQELKANNTIMQT